MRLPSNTTFDGGKPTKPGTPLTILWQKDMVFTGRDADFYGNIQAYQDDSTLVCQQLSVELDRPVSLKEGQKSGQAAKVEKVISHKDVRIEEKVKDSRGQIIKDSILYCHTLNVDNPQNSVRTSGPGVVATLQYGSPSGFGPVRALEEHRRTLAKTGTDADTHPLPSANAVQASCRRGIPRLSGELWRYTFPPIHGTWRLILIGCLKERCG